jgi:hypothetical protein
VADIRDPRVTIDHLEQEIALCEREILHIQQGKMKQELPDWKKVSNLYHFYFYNYYKILFFRLALGDEFQDLRNLFPEVLASLEKTNEASLALTDSKEEFKSALKLNNQDRYKTAFGLLFFALALKIDPGQFERLLELIPVGDQLLDKVISKFQPERKIGEKLYFPKSHRTLLDVIDAPHDKQFQLLTKHLKKWEKSLDVYQPYWCYDVAVVLQAFQIDDHEFRDYPHYPYDIIHWNHVG